MHTILQFLGTAAAVALTVHLVPGVRVSGASSVQDMVQTGAWATVLLFALLWSVVTMVVRPILQLITLPVTIVTFGLFAFVLNAFLFWAMTLIVPGFEVAGFIPAFLGAIVLSLLTWLIQRVL